MHLDRKQIIELESCMLLPWNMLVLSVSTTVKSTDCVDRMTNVVVFVLQAKCEWRRLGH